MSRRAERLWRRLILGAAGVLGAGSLGLGSWALLFPPRAEPPALRGDAAPETGRDRALPKAELDALVAKRISKTVVKVVPPPPPPPPKPPAPPLDSLVRLSGITDFGNGSPPEAMIETKAQSQTRTYRIGETIGQTGATILAISETVDVSYDGKRWRLTFRGVEVLPNEAVSGN